MIEQRFSLKLGSITILISLKFGCFLNMWYAVSKDLRKGETIMILALGIFYFTISYYLSHYRNPIQLNGASIISLRISYINYYYQKLVAEWAAPIEITLSVIIFLLKIEPFLILSVLFLTISLFKFFNLIIFLTYLIAILIIFLNFVPFMVLFNNSSVFIKVSRALSCIFSA